jgi:hypothetical protein
MKQTRIQRPRVRDERPWLDVLPLDLRDRDIVRAKDLTAARLDASRRPDGRRTR